MRGVNLSSIEPLVTILLVLVHPKCAQTKRRKRCLTAWKVTGVARPCDVRSVRESLVSSDTIGGERRFAPGSASTSSRRAGKVTTIGWAGSKSLSTSRPRTARGRHDALDLWLLRWTGIDKRHLRDVAEVSSLIWIVAEAECQNLILSLQDQARPPAEL